MITLYTGKTKDFNMDIFHILAGCGPEEEVAARLGVPALEGAGPEDPAGVGSHLVNLPPPAPPATPAQGRRGGHVSHRGRWGHKLGTVIARVIGTECSK